MKNAGKNPNRLAHALAQFSVAAYGIIRMIDALSSGDTTLAALTLISVVIVMNLLVLLHFLNRLVSEAFTIPMTIFLTNIAASFVTGSFRYYFILYAGICCLAALYFNPKDSEDMADRMVSLASDRALNRDMRAAGLERAKFFSWDACAERTLNIIMETAGAL